MCVGFDFWTIFTYFSDQLSDFIRFYWQILKANQNDQQPYILDKNVLVESYLSINILRLTKYRTSQGWMKITIIFLRVSEDIKILLHINFKYLP